MFVGTVYDLLTYEKVVFEHNKFAAQRVAVHDSSRSLPCWGYSAKPHRQDGYDLASASARHILVSTEDECNDLKTQIEGGADFADLAKAHSQCPSGQSGGDLGEFGPGQMVKEFDEVVFSADLNMVQGPVKTQFGYHLLEVMSRTE